MFVCVCVGIVRLWLCPVVLVAAAAVAGAMGEGLKSSNTPTEGSVYLAITTPFRVPVH